VSGPFLSTVRRPRRRARKALVVLALAAGVAAVLAVAFGAIALLERDTLPRGTTIAGVDVGGLTESDARVAVARAAATRLDVPIRLVGPGGALASTSGREIHARPLVADAVAEASDGGSLARVLGRVGLREGRQVELAYRLGPVAVARLANRLDDRFGEPWRDARVDVAAESIRVVEARPGTGVDRKALRRSLQALPTRVQLQIVTVRPLVSSSEATAAVSRVERLLDTPRHVRFRDTDATLTRQRLRSLVRTGPVDGGLGLSLEPKGLGASLRVKLGRFEVAPENATFAVGAAGVRVVPSRPGRTLDVDRIGRSLVSDLASTIHLARFASRSPSLTTEDAEKLDIRERVSEFTTYYSCCQPRVTNIQRAAQMLDGTIVESGESF
jgi:vancomycin resistance protein YoaR